ISAADDTSVVLTWNKPAGGPYGYGISRGVVTNQGFEFIQVVDDPTSSTSQSRSDSGLVPGTAYFYKVRAVNNAGNASVLSGEASATTTTLNGPNLTVNAVDGTHISLDVTRLSGYDYYEFYRSQVNTPPTPSTAPTAPPAAVTRRDGTDFTLVDVVTGGTWFYAVRGRFTPTGPPTPWSALLGATTFSGTPATPANLSVVAAGNNQVLLQWDASFGASGYTVKRSLDGTSFTTVGSPAV